MFLSLSLLLSLNISKWVKIFFFKGYFFKYFIYLFILERGKGREKEEKNINVWLPLTSPYWGPGPQPRHAPRLGIELATLCFTVWHHSIH